MTWIEKITKALGNRPRGEPAGDNPAADLGWGEAMSETPRRDGADPEDWAAALADPPSAAKSPPVDEEEPEEAAEPESSPRHMTPPSVEEMSGPTRALAQAAAAAAAYGRSAGAPPPGATPECAALIQEAMTYWATGHAIFQRLDPKIRATISAVAEELAPK